MPRPNQTREKRRELLPTITAAFAELGYRRTTTAELARRCGVQENVLYRLWPDKKRMFVAAIGHVYEQSAAIWRTLLADGDGGATTAERLLAHESSHHGEFGYYRIVFAGLSETDDPEIRAALATMYQRYQHLIRRQVSEHRKQKGDGETLDAGAAAWAVVGLGTLSNIARELGLMSERQRRRLFSEVGRLILAGSGA